MLFNTQILPLAALFSTLASARPLDAQNPRDLAARSRSYTIINVDGGSSTGAPAQATTVLKETQTVQVANPGPTVTQQITSVVYQPAAPAPASTNSSSISTSSASTSSLVASSTVLASTSASTPIETASPSYYDNGMWHTYYQVKTPEAAVTASTVSTFSTSTISNSTVSTSLYTAPSALPIPVRRALGGFYNSTSLLASTISNSTLPVLPTPVRRALGGLYNSTSLSNSTISTSTLPVLPTPVVRRALGQLYNSTSLSNSTVSTSTLPVLPTPVVRRALGQLYNTTSLAPVRSWNQTAY
ncbi:uncharacterized protein K460DRAFT_370398 [Cucurbitaria berberidis CBS 394.84]|uniref:Uncharacterized protein n=1 Tax=Cucurbitaria berberidis CBS 394.84 TaxID=1168544 RepID=A0A9P4GAX2_9PLEO|nr:uncharacterized protein K460DRAFT_370398 [Cucurbitaria berberidis CBS 394.84]KAF1842433.1 hypothetical protein K460DRAFT_370398 [Cucurbitaria berberidis CBS 394.84]